jgi:outer membrane protein assembly factor BamE (lipoprotein component of BamABCDE complex)
MVLNTREETEMNARNVMLVWALFASGCTTTQGARIDAAQTADFKAGQTTKAQVVGALGAPYSQSTAPSGTVLLYVFSRQTAQGSNFVPVLNWFKGRTDSESQTCRFLFDPKDVYTGYDCAGTSGTQRAALEQNKVSPAH